MFFAIFSSYIIAGWIWISTWGIYQFPLSWLSATIILRIKIFKYLSQAMGLSALFYGGATLVYWLFLFLPVHILTPNNHHVAVVPSAFLITSFLAVVYTLIQACFYKIMIKKYPVALAQSFLVIFAIANMVGALLAFYSLRFVGTVIDW